MITFSFNININLTNNCWISHLIFVPTEKAREEKKFEDPKKKAKEEKTFEDPEEKEKEEENLNLKSIEEGNLESIKEAGMSEYFLNCL